MSEDEDLDERERKARNRSARADRAKVLLEDELLVEAFAQVERQYTTAWKTSRYGDTEGREAAYRGLAALQEVKAKLEATMRDGPVAREELTAIQRLRQGFRRVANF